MDAAVKLFAEKGYPSVSNREIAQAAGANTALISYYFGSKEGLYVQAFQTQFSTACQALAAIRNQQALTPVERIEQCALAVLESHRKHPHLLRFVQHELVNPSTASSQVLHACTGDLLRYLEELVEEGKAAGAFHAELNTSYAALMLCNLMHSYLLHKNVVAAVLPEFGEEQEYVMHNLSIYFRGVLAEKTVGGA